MKVNKPALAMLFVLAASSGVAAAASDREVVKSPSVTSVSAFVQAWQQRILSENLPVIDARTWGLRNLPKFAAFSAERLQLAMRANTLVELEALLVSAPVATGTNLALLMSTKPGNISVDAMQPGASGGAVQKLDLPRTRPCIRT